MFFFVKMLFWVLGGVGIVSLLIASVVSAMKTKSEGGISSFLMMVFMIVVVCPLYVYIMPEDVRAPKAHAIAKVEVDPMLEARRERARELDRENKRMEEYAESKQKELTAKSTRIAVNPSSVDGMAEYRYYLKSGKIVSCLRGFDGDVLAFNCTNYSFDR